jgi:hypothetical protein
LFQELLGIYLVDFYNLRTQDYISILTLSQEYNSELSITLDPPKEN